MFDTRVDDELGSVVADLGVLLSRLGRVAVGSAGTEALLRAAAGLEDAVTAVQVLQARVLATLDVVSPSDERLVGATPVLDLSRVSAHEVSSVLGCSVESARTRVHVAQTACGGLPATLAAATAGRLQWWQVRRVVDAVDAACLDEGAVRAVDARVAAEAIAGRAASSFGRRLSRAVLAAGPVAAERSRREAVADRRVVLSPGRDGMSWLGASLPAEEALVVGRCLDELADTAVSVPYGLVGPLAGPDPRTADQRRADALSGLARLVLDVLQGAPAGSGTEPRTGQSAAESAGGVVDRLADAVAGSAASRQERRRRRRPRTSAEVAVTVSIETLMGLSQAAGELAGYGPITAEHARRIAGAPGSVWHRLLTDPVSGTVLDRGRTTYSPPAGLADHVAARGEGRCSRPDCDHRAVDLDHAEPWWSPDGGPGGRTSAANLHGVCRGCHTAKHSGWVVRIGPDGTTTWTTPHGWVSTAAPPDLRPDDRHPPPPATGVTPGSGSPVIHRAAAPAVV